jgi:glycosyltransferase involved in cell wall biosynthesis
MKDGESVQYRRAGLTVHMPKPSLHVISLVYFYEPDLTSPDELLQRYSTIRPLAHALHQEGAEVTVFQRFHQNISFEDQGVAFEFRADGCHPSLRKWQIPYSFHSAIRDACARSKSKQIVVHMNGLFYPLQMRSLRNLLSADCALVAQHHAEKPWPKFRSPLQRWGLRTADGFFFAAQELAASWIDRGVISEKQRVFEVMEGSTCFRYEERPAARVRTGLAGAPVVLWVGNLTANKDPLTVLAGFERILERIPQARLYMAYRLTDLLNAVRDRITSSPTLATAVTLLGSVEHAQLEDIYNSADYFVAGSHYEGSGFALAEAMACGVVPVVTDIPAFRAMTDAGRIGACWTAGDASSFSEVFLQVLRRPVKELSAQAVQGFDQRLSYPAIAGASMSAYEKLTSARLESAA